MYDKSEHKILSTLQETTMVVAAYKSKKISDEHTTTGFVIGY